MLLAPWPATWRWLENIEHIHTTKERSHIVLTSSVGWPEQQRRDPLDMFFTLKMNTVFAMQNFASLQSPTRLTRPLQ